MALTVGLIITVMLQLNILPSPSLRGRMAAIRDQPELSSSCTAVMLASKADS